MSELVNALVERIDVIRRSWTFRVTAVMLRTINAVRRALTAPLRWFRKH